MVRLHLQPLKTGVFKTHSLGCFFFSGYTTCLSHPYILYRGDSQIYRSKPELLPELQSRISNCPHIFNTSLQLDVSCSCHPPLQFLTCTFFISVNDNFTPPVAQAKNLEVIFDSSFSLTTCIRLLSKLLLDYLFLSSPTTATIHSSLHHLLLGLLHQLPNSFVQIQVRSCHSPNFLFHTE